MRADFIDSLLLELALHSDWSVPFDTVYLGGGTPSLLTPAQLERIARCIAEQLPLAADARWFMEANPEDVNADSTAAWRELGVRTLSLGVQSFVDAELRQLGRRHSGDDAVQAVRTCMQSGFETVSVDLMFGLPGQTAASLGASLATVLELAPQHISGYQLTVHDGTTFGRWQQRGKVHELPEGEQRELFDQLHDTLEAAGWHAYEVSNFARSPAHRSKHNLKYWQHQPYLGVGPAAHSFDGRKRWWNQRDLGGYRETLAAGRLPQAGSEHLSDGDLALEVLMLGLRTRDGINMIEFQRRFGVDLQARNHALLTSLQDQGCLDINHPHLQPTRAGLAVADGLAARFSLDPD